MGPAEPEPDQSVGLLGPGAAFLWITLLLGPEPGLLEEEHSPSNRENPGAGPGRRRSHPAERGGGKGGEEEGDGTERKKERKRNIQTWQI